MLPNGGDRIMRVAAAGGLAITDGAINGPSAHAQDGVDCCVAAPHGRETPSSNASSLPKGRRPIAGPGCARPQVKGDVRAPKPAICKEEFAKAPAQRDVGEKGPLRRAHHIAAWPDARDRPRRVGAAAERAGLDVLPYLVL